MNKYVIEKMDLSNAQQYARISALAWLQSYKEIVNDTFLKLINTEEEIQKVAMNLKSAVNDDSQRFLLKYDDEYVGILRVRKTKYEKYANLYYYDIIFDSAKI